MNMDYGKGLGKAGWSASTLCRNDNNGNVCRRSTGHPQFTADQTEIRLAKSCQTVQLSIEEYLEGVLGRTNKEVIDVSAYKLNGRRN